MRKFAAHYLLTDSGLLLKNGFAVLEENGSLKFTDTEGELVEIEQMIFHSGLLMGAFEFIKRADSTYNSPNLEKSLPLFDALLKKDHLALKEIIEVAKQLQDHLPELNVPQLLDTIEQVFLSRAFIKKQVPGLFLLSGLDLARLRFTPDTQLKKII